MAVEKYLQEQNSRTILAIPNNDSKKLPQYFAAALATLSAFAAGVCLSWTSPAQPLLQQPDSIPRISDEQASWVGALITLGACLGAIPAGPIAHSIGSKRLLQSLSVPIFVSWMMIAFSGCVWALYAARLLAGLAIGAISVTAPMYVAELAESRIRGTLGTFFQLQITIGILFEYVVGAFVIDFQMLALVSSILPVVFLLTFSWMPESPVYLSSQGHLKEARKSLQWFRGADYDVEDELTRIQDNIKDHQKNKAHISDIFNCKATSKAMIISLGLMVFQQLSGINAVIFYAEKIFQSAGSTMSPALCTIVVGTVQVLATYLSTLLIDKTGRKILLLISASVMSLCLGTLSAYFHFSKLYDLSEFSFVPLGSVALFIIVFSLGFGPIPWMMMGEIFPAKIKGLASSISAASNWTLAFLVTKFFQNMLNMLGSAVTFGIFGSICLLGTAFVLFVVPETKGKDLHEIQLLLTGEHEKVSTIEDGYVYEDDEMKNVTINFGDKC